MALELRNLAYSETHGVYLGGDNWSFVNPTGGDIAPTFRTNIDAMKAMGKGRPTFKLIQAFPDVNGAGVHLEDGGNLHCSQDAVAASGLPRWDPNAVGVPKYIRGHTQEQADQKMAQVAQMKAERDAAGEEVQSKPEPKSIPKPKSSTDDDDDNDLDDDDETPLPAKRKPVKKK